MVVKMDMRWIVKSRVDFHEDPVKAWQTNAKRLTRKNRTRLWTVGCDLRRTAQNQNEDGGNNDV